MAEFERTWGRLTLSLTAYRPTLNHVFVDIGEIYNDGITAGIGCHLAWVSATLSWVWNHNNCPSCRLDETHDL